MTRIAEVNLTLHAEESRALARGATLLVVPMVPQPSAGARWNTIVLNGYGGWTDGHGAPLRCPLVEGAVLVGREEWQVVAWQPDTNPIVRYSGGGYEREVGDEMDENWMDEIWAQCTDDCINAGLRLDEDGMYTFDDAPTRIRPASTMPPELSRHRYPIAIVDARRVQSVTDAEAKLCGIERRNRGFAAYEGDSYYPQARLSFASFIRTIYGPSAWTENRYCWFLTLDRAARAAKAEIFK